jgi:hypothetical protein
VNRGNGGSIAAKWALDAGASPSGGYPPYPVVVEVARGREFLGGSGPLLALIHRTSDKRSSGNWASAKRLSEKP